MNKSNELDARSIGIHLNSKLEEFFALKNPTPEVERAYVDEIVAYAVQYKNLTGKSYVHKYHSPQQSNPSGKQESTSNKERKNLGSVQTTLDSGDTHSFNLSHHPPWRLKGEKNRRDFA